MKLMEAALLLTVFFLLRTVIKRLPTKFWVIMEALLFARLLLPSFPSMPVNVWDVVEVNPTVVRHLPVKPVSLFHQINPWIVLALLLAGLMSYFILLRKRKYPGEEENLYYHDGETAYVLGIFRPKIFLPLEEDERKKNLLLLHEQMHIRRGDPQLLFFSYVVLSLNWYNPLVWLLYFRMRQDMDLACDEAVLSLGVDPKEYASLLLEKSSTFNPLVPGLRWFSIKERLMQMKRKKITMGIALLVFIVLLVVLLPFLNGKNVIGSGDGSTDIWIDTENEQPENETTEEQEEAKNELIKKEQEELAKVEAVETQKESERETEIAHLILRSTQIKEKINAAYEKMAKKVATLEKEVNTEEITEETKNAVDLSSEENEIVDLVDKLATVHGKIEKLRSEKKSNP